MSYRHISLTRTQLLYVHTPRGLVQVEIARRDSALDVDLIIQDRDGVRLEVVEKPIIESTPQPQARKVSR